jgi:type IV pilus assembly protein PilA
VTCIEVDLGKYTSASAKPTLAKPGFAWSGAGDDPKNPGISGPCPGCNVDGYAGGQIDNDKIGVDSWYISTKDATATTPPCGADATETNAVAGTPYNTYNDVDCDT